MTDPIAKTIHHWHQFMEGRTAQGADQALDDLLAEECAFYSPVVFTPQRDKATIKMYLTAAGYALGDGGTPDAPTGHFVGEKFHYVNEICQGNMAMLEFKTVIDDIEVNGVDIISCNDAGKITEFKVMIRPLQAINLVHQKMGAMLQTMMRK